MTVVPHGVRRVPHGLTEGELFLTAGLLSVRGRSQGLTGRGVFLTTGPLSVRRGAQERTMGFYRLRLGIIGRFPSKGSGQAGTHGPFECRLFWSAGVAALNGAAPGQI